MATPLDVLPKSIRPVCATLAAIVTIVGLLAGAEAYMDKRADAAVTRSPVLVEIRDDQKSMKDDLKDIKAAQERHSCALAVVARQGSLADVLACDVR